jgi:hypothetical protein
MQSSFTLAVLVAVLALTSPAAAAAAPSALWLAGQGGGASSSAQAAEQAKRQTGGKVLSVRETSGGWEVKVLTASGEVLSVFIPGSGR